MANSLSWKKIFDQFKIHQHDFDQEPFHISADQIKKACQNFKKTGEKEPRLLCKQDKREDRPDVFKDMGLFILPIKNKHYAIVRGEGYVDIPLIESSVQTYSAKLDFRLVTSEIGDSEMQHLDYAYATSLIRSFTEDSSLLLTIRGRKYTPSFSFNVDSQKITVTGVQTEVDAGYEGRDRVVLVEAKRSDAKNVIIRQLYYPFRQWQIASKKKVTTLFFEKNKKKDLYSIWQFEFDDPSDYNSIRLVKSGSFKVEVA